MGSWAVMVGVALLLGGWPGASVAEGTAVLVREPTILGPSGSVRHVDTGGFEAGYDWVLTQGLGNPEVNAALWEAPLAEGAYQVEVFLPKEIGDTYARYQVTHADQVSEARLRQYSFLGEWVVLGDWAFDSAQASVRSTDASGYPGEELAWSAVRFTSLASLPPNIESNGTETTINEPQVSGPEEFVVRFVGVGYRGDLLRVDARGAGATAVNSATWSVALARGEYAVEAFIPAEHAEAEVTYEVHARDGTPPFSLLQKSYNNLWVSLGDYKFGEAGGSVSSDDATGVKEQQIAWDAIRFKLIKPEPVEKEPAKEPAKEPTKEPAKEPVGEAEVHGVGGKTSALPSPSEQLIAPAPAPPLAAAVAVPNDLLEFVHLRVKAARGHRPNPQNLYKIAALLHATGLTARYRCAPCLIVRLPFKLRPHSNVPITTSSTAEGEVKTLIKQEPELYAGTVLKIELSETDYRSELVTYHLRTQARIKRSQACPAAPGPIGLCAS